MYSKLDYVRRLIGTGISFLFFGVGGAILGLTVFPLLLLFIRSPETRQHIGRKIVRATFRFFLELMRVLGVMSYDIQGREYLQQSQGNLIIANHPSLIDVIFLVALFEQVSCIVKGALFKNPFTFGPIKAAGYIPNTSSEQLMQACVENLQEGKGLIVFPEGTRTTPGAEINFQRGAAGMAVRSGADITPVTITCVPTTLTKNEPWYRIPSRRFKMTLVIKEPITVKQVVGENYESNLPAAARKLTRYLEHYFKQEIAG